MWLLRLGRTRSRTAAAEKAEESRAGVAESRGAEAEAELARATEKKQSAVTMADALAMPHLSLSQMLQAAIENRAEAA